MGYLPDRKARTIFITGSAVLRNGKRRNIVIESRPEFAIVKLCGTKTNYPLAWESIYEVAVQHHAANLSLESQALPKLKNARGINKK